MGGTPGVPPISHFCGYYLGTLSTGCATHRPFLWLLSCHLIHRVCHPSAIFVATILAPYPPGVPPIDHFCGYYLVTLSTRCATHQPFLWLLSWHLIHRVCHPSTIFVATTLSPYPPGVPPISHFCGYYLVTLSTGCATHQPFLWLLSWHLIHRVCHPSTIFVATILSPYPPGVPPINHFCGYYIVTLSTGFATHQPFLWLLSWCPIHLVKSLQTIWRSGNRRFHHQASTDPNLSCNFFYFIIFF